MMYSEYKGHVLGVQSLCTETELKDIRQKSCSQDKDGKG